MKMFMAATLGAARRRCFSIPDRSGDLLCLARGHLRRILARIAAIGAGRHTDQLGETSAESAQRRTANLEADLGDAEVTTTQQGHRALDAPRHQVAVRRLAVGAPELAAEVPRRHVRIPCQRLDVQRLGVLSVDPVADPAQLREVAQALPVHGFLGCRAVSSHARIVASPVPARPPRPFARVDTPRLAVQERPNGVASGSWEKHSRSALTSAAAASRAHPSTCPPASSPRSAPGSRHPRADVPTRSPTWWPSWRVVAPRKTHLSASPSPASWYGAW